MDANKEYVDFYYFWLAEYAIRKFEIDVERTTAPLRDEVERRYKVLDDACEACEFKRIQTFDSYLEKNEAGGWTPVSARCCSNNFNCDYFRAHSQALHQIETTEQTLFFNSVLPSLYSDGIDCEKCKVEYAVSASLLFDLYNDGAIEKAVCRNQNGLGLEVIGTKGIYINDRGCLSGNVIVGLDLSLPSGLLLHEINALKKITFEKSPTFDELIDAVAFGRTNYDLEKDIIQDLAGAAFNPNDDTPRAIGLWLWDNVDLDKKFKSVAEAVRVLRRGNFNAATDPDPDDLLPDLLDRLGYGNSPEGTFNRLYRNTKRCIEAGEVLSLKD